MTKPPAEGKTAEPVTPPTETPEAAATAEGLMVAAIRSLESRFSVEARFRQQADLFGQKLVGAGVYYDVQPGRNHQYRMELKLRGGTQESSLLQVCDGRYLWNYRTLGEDVSLTRIDVVEVVQALAERDNVPVPGQLGAWPGFGGLPRLLRGLHLYFQFVSAVPEQFEAVDPAGRTRPVPVWRLLGRWQPERLADVLPAQRDSLLKGEAPDWRGLPEHMPDHVLLFLGQETLFPLRIEYRRTLSEAAAPPGQGESRFLVVMDWTEVNLNVPIDPARFHYQPGQVEVGDQTGRFVKSLDLRQPQ